MYCLSRLATCLPLLLVVVALCLLSRQQCGCAAIRHPKDNDDNNQGNSNNNNNRGGIADEDDEVDEYIVNVRARRDLNITGSDDVGFGPKVKGKRHGRSHRLQNKVAKLEQTIKGMQDELNVMKKFVSKLQASSLKKEKCAMSMCPVGSLKYGCDCLLYVHRNATWMDARDYCSNMSGKLVSIQSKGIQKHIRTFLRAQLGPEAAQYAQVFTGLIYTTQEHPDPSYVGSGKHHGQANGWYWVALNNSNTLLKSDDFVFWVENHPHPDRNQTMYGSKSCMHLEGNKKFKWVSSHCSNTKRFICHFNAVPKRLRGLDRENRGRKNKRNKNKKK